MYYPDEQPNNLSPSFVKIVEDFAQATDFASVLVNIHGIETSRLYNFSSFCSKMRTHKEFRHLCQKCDMYGGLEASKSGNHHIYRCHAGLTDISFPLVQKNQLSGFLQIGQVRLESAFQSTIPTIFSSESNWTNFQDLRREYEKIPEISPKKLHSTIRLLEQINSYHLDEEQKNRIEFNIKKPRMQKQSIEIQNAIDYIQKNITRNLPLEEVANHVYLSQYYFSKLFKKEMNVNFSTYLNQQKIERAKTLLQNHSLSVETIAFNLGFTHSSYFCKLFKSIVGITPAAYRKSNFCKIILQDGEKTLKEKTMHFRPNDTLLDLLINCFNIQLDNEFITSIDQYSQDVKQGKYWTFTINQKFIYESAKRVQLKPNDLIILNRQTYLS